MGDMSAILVALHKETIGKKRCVQRCSSYIAYTTGDKEMHAYSRLYFDGTIACRKSVFGLWIQCWSWRLVIRDARYDSSIGDLYTYIAIAAVTCIVCCASYQYFSARMDICAHIKISHILIPATEVTPFFISGFLFCCCPSKCPIVVIFLYFFFIFLFFLCM